MMESRTEPHDRWSAKGVILLLSIVNGPRGFRTYRAIARVFVRPVIELQPTSLGGGKWLAGRYKFTTKGQGGKTAAAIWIQRKLCI